MSKMIKWLLLLAAVMQNGVASAEGLVFTFIESAEGTNVTFQARCLFGGNSPCDQAPFGSPLDVASISNQTTESLTAEISGFNLARPVPEFDFDFTVYLTEPGTGTGPNAVVSDFVHGSYTFATTLLTLDFMSDIEGQTLGSIAAGSQVQEEVLGPHVYLFKTGQWGAEGFLEIADVPEPSTLWLLGAVALATGLTLNRKPRGCR